MTPPVPADLHHLQQPRHIQAVVERLLYHAILPIIRVSQCFGSAPLGFSLAQLRDVKSNDHHHDHVRHTSAASATYATSAAFRPSHESVGIRVRLLDAANQARICAYFVLLCYALHHQYTFYDVYSDWMDRFLYAVRHITYALNVLLVFVGARRQRAEYGRTFRRIVQMDVDFVRLLEHLTPDDADGSYGGGVASRLAALDYAELGVVGRIGLVSFAGLLTGWCIVNYFYQTGGWAALVHSSLLLIVPNWTLGSCQMQLVLVMRLLRSRFRLIGAIMERCLVDGGGGRTDGLHRVRTVRAIPQRKRNGDGPERRRLERTLYRLGRLHARLNQTNAALTGYFGMLLCGNFVSVCLAMTIIFFTFYQVASGHTGKTFEVPLALYLLMWLGMYGLRVSAVLLHNVGMNRDRRAVLGPLHRLECDAVRKTSEAERNAVSFREELCVVFF